MDDVEKTVADMIKVPFRGAAPAQAAMLIGTTTPPPPGTWTLEIPFTDADVIPDPDDEEENDD